MKFHKLYIAAIGAASMSMAGCELDIVNSDQLNTTNMWVDESDVTGATTGIYFELRNAFGRITRTSSSGANCASDPPCGIAVRTVR